MTQGTDATTKWLAICSNGAVALGAYEAGVIAQLYADTVEANPKDGARKVAIDAVAGASAGAVTSALLAQAIAIEAAPSELTQRLRDAWIDGLNVDALLGDTNNPANAAFDPKALKDLAPRVILSDEDMKKAAAGASGRYPVAMWIALTNLDGIPYRIPIQDGTVIASLYADYEPLIVMDGVAHKAPPVETLKNKTVELGPVVPWDDVVTIVTTSGAFPFAFRSQMLTRDLADYPKAVIPGGGKPTRMKFNYVDGGVLNNSPLGRAIDAASFLEPHGHSQDGRTFLVIEPDPMTVQDAQNALANIRQDDDGPGLPPLNLAAKIVGTYFNEAMYRDLKEALDTNEHISGLNGQLGPLVASGRLTQDEADSIRGAAGLGYKKVIAIERIPGEQRRQPLAGAFAGHFGGFFDKRYREYDFAVGCYEARRWFRRWCSDATLGPNLQSGITESEPPPPITPGKFKGIDQAALAKTKDKLAARASSLAARVAPSGCLLGAAMPLLFPLLRKWVRKQLDKALQ